MKAGHEYEIVSMGDKFGTEHWPCKDANADAILDATSITGGATLKLVTKFTVDENTVAEPWQR